MEVTVTDFNSLPDNSIVSIRFGATRRQAPLGTAKEHPLKFPLSLQDVREPLKIDVLQPIASARLVLHEFAESYRIGFDDLNNDGSDANPLFPKDMALGLNVAPAGKGEHRPSGDRSHPTTPFKFQDAAASAREYLENHGLLRYVQALLHAVITVKPDDPFAFMIKQLSAPQSKSRPTSASANHDDVKIPPSMPEPTKEPKEKVEEMPKATMEPVPPKGPKPPLPPVQPPSRASSAPAEKEVPPPAADSEVPPPSVAPEEKSEPPAPAPEPPVAPVAAEKPANEPPAPAAELLPTPVPAVQASESLPLPEKSAPPAQEPAEEPAVSTKVPEPAPAPAAEEPPAPPPLPAKEPAPAEEPATVEKSAPPDEPAFVEEAAPSVCKSAPSAEELTTPTPAEAEVVAAAPVPVETIPEATARLRKELGGEDVMLVCIVGSVHFQGADNEVLTQLIAKKLNDQIPANSEVRYITGGLAGVQETFVQQLSDSSKVFNLLPYGSTCPYNHGSVVYGGVNLNERKEIFSLLGDVYVLIEGGPSAAAEVNAGFSRGAKVVPLIRTGGAASGMFNLATDVLSQQPFALDDEWRLLRDEAATIETTAGAAANMLLRLITGAEAEAAPAAEPTPAPEPASKPAPLPEVAAAPVPVETAAEAMVRLKKDLGGDAAMRVCIVGSVQFQGEHGEALTQLIARKLNDQIPTNCEVRYITGGMTGVQETFVKQLSDSSKVFNLVPYGSTCPYDHGSVLHGGLDLSERKEIFGLIGDVYVLIEGGPGAAVEVGAAFSRGAKVVPLIRTGGAAGGMFNLPADVLSKQPFAFDDEWSLLSDDAAPVETTADAAANILIRLITSGKADALDQMSLRRLATDTLVEGSLDGRLVGILERVKNDKIPTPRPVEETAPASPEPVAEEAAPPATEEKPAASEPAQKEATEPAPAAEEAKPSEEPAPAAEEAKPAEDVLVPAAEEATPAEEVPALAAKESKPAEETAPAAEETKPTVEAVPADEAKPAEIAPTAVEAKPAEELAPAKEGSTPAEEPAPTSEEAKLAEEPAPASEEAKPAEEPAPAAEEVKPAEEARPAVEAAGLTEEAATSVAAEEPLRECRKMAIDTLSKEPPAPQEQSPVLDDEQTEEVKQRIKGVLERAADSGELNRAVDAVLAAEKADAEGAAAVAPEPEVVAEPKAEEPAAPAPEPEELALTHEEQDTVDLRKKMKDLLEASNESGDLQKILTEEKDAKAASAAPAPPAEAEKEAEAAPLVTEAEKEVPPAPPALPDEAEKEVPPAPPALPDEAEKEAEAAPSVTEAEKEVPPAPPALPDEAEKEVPPAPPALPDEAEKEVPPVPPALPDEAEKEVPPAPPALPQEAKEAPPVEEPAAAEAKEAPPVEEPAAAEVKEALPAEAAAPAVPAEAQEASPAEAPAATEAATSSSSVPPVPAESSNNADTQAIRANLRSRFEEAEASGKLPEILKSVFSNSEASPSAEKGPADMEEVKKRMVESLEEADASGMLNQLLSQLAVEPGTPREDIHAIKVRLRSLLEDACDTGRLHEVLRSVAATDPAAAPPAKGSVQPSIKELKSKTRELMEQALDSGILEDTLKKLGQETQGGEAASAAESSAAPAPAPAELMPPQEGPPPAATAREELAQEREPPAVVEPADEEGSEPTITAEEQSIIDIRKGLKTTLQKGLEEGTLDSVLERVKTPRGEAEKPAAPSMPHPQQETPEPPPGEPAAMPAPTPAPAEATPVEAAPAEATSAEAAPAEEAAAGQPDIEVANSDNLEKLRALLKQEFTTRVESGDLHNVLERVLGVPNDATQEGLSQVEIPKEETQPTLGQPSQPAEEAVPEPSAKEVPEAVAEAAPPAPEAQPAPAVEAVPEEPMPAKAMPPAEDEVAAVVDSAPAPMPSVDEEKPAEAAVAPAVAIGESAIVAAVSSSSAEPAAASSSAGPPPPPQKTPSESSGSEGRKEMTRMYDRMLSQIESMNQDNRSLNDKVNSLATDMESLKRTTAMLKSKVEGQ